MSKSSKHQAPAVRPWWHRERVHTVLEGESMTHQSHAADCDINRIIKRYDRTGALPPGRSDGRYADVTPLQGDFTERVLQSREAMHKVADVVKTRKRKKAEEQVTIEEELQRLRQENASLKGRGETGDQPGES